MIIIIVLNVYSHTCYKQHNNMIDVFYVFKFVRYVKRVDLSPKYYASIKVYIL